MFKGWMPFFLLNNLWKSFQKANAIAEINPLSLDAYSKKRAIPSVINNKLFFENIPKSITNPIVNNIIGPIIFLEPKIHFLVQGIVPKISLKNFFMPPFLILEKINVNK